MCIAHMRVRVCACGCVYTHNCFYAPHSGKSEEEKETFWNEMFHLVSCIPQNEMIVLAGVMNGHVGSSNAGNDGTHGGFEYGDRKADGSRILELADGPYLVICNTLFMKQESQLVTYAAHPVKSTNDYIIVQQEDKAKVRNVKVIPNEECVPKHTLLVMDMQFKTRKRWRKKFEPRVHVWKLKEEKTCEEYQSMIKDKVEEAEWKYNDVKEHRQQMKNVMMDTAQVTCGLSKGPGGHKETWRWNEELLKHTYTHTQPFYGSIVLGVRSG